ncbi:MAG: rhodanese-related sulfurtransferase [Bacteroidota bacterium]
MNKNYTILLYYHYTPIQDLVSFSKKHHSFCVKNQLLGRIIIAKEGINGTVSGLESNCKKYMAYLRADSRFADIDFKITPSQNHVFRKLNVRIKPEIVHAGLKELDPTLHTGQHLSVDEFEQMSQQNDVVLLDARSNYEHRLGKFKNALTLDINHFREFPEKAKTLNHLKKKKIITYCTGGVKCEKASAYLLAQGFEQVYQLKGGIIRYGEKTDGSAFEGTCYVFDNRLSVPINSKNPTIISKCHLCQEASDRMVNCANPACNIHVPICDTCSQDYEGACSKVCQKSPSKRNYNGTGYYTKQLNGYQPSQGFRK